jgi:hypothetical protein
MRGSARVGQAVPLLESIENAADPHVERAVKKENALLIGVMGVRLVARPAARLND